MSSPTLKEGSTVLLLGASSGIGHALVVRLTGRGIDLVLAGRAPEALADATAEIRTEHGVAVRTLRFEASSPKPTRTSSGGRVRS